MYSKCTALFSRILRFYQFFKIFRYHLGNQGPSVLVKSSEQATHVVTPVTWPRRAEKPRSPGEPLPTEDRLMPESKQSIAPAEALAGSLRDYRELHGPDLLGR